MVHETRPRFTLGQLLCAIIAVCVAAMVFVRADVPPREYTFLGLFLSLLIILWSGLHRTSNTGYWITYVLSVLLLACIGAIASTGFSPVARLN